MDNPTTDKDWTTTELMLTNQISDQIGHYYNTPALRKLLLRRRWLAHYICMQKNVDWLHSFIEHTTYDMPVKKLRDLLDYSTFKDTLRSVYALDRLPFEKKATQEEMDAFAESAC